MDIYLPDLAVHHAVSNGHSEFTTILAQFGGNYEKPDKMGATPIFYAAKYNQEQCLKVLVGFGADLNHRK